MEEGSERSDKKICLNCGSVQKPEAKAVLCVICGKAGLIDHNRRRLEKRLHRCSRCGSTGRADWDNVAKRYLACCSRESCQNHSMKFNPHEWQEAGWVFTEIYNRAKFLEQERSQIADKIERVLVGIDRTETDNNDGWWETSKGAEFGAKILSKIQGILEKGDAK